MLTASWYQSWGRVVGRFRGIKWLSYRVSPPGARDAPERHRGRAFGLLRTENTPPIDDLVENSRVNSSVELEALFDLEMKGMVRQLPGKQFLKVLL